MRREQLPALEALMARMADGDRTAVAEFHAEFGDDLEASVGYWASHFHARLAREDAEALAFDAAVVIFGVAGGWTPAGAYPWRWASKRIMALVSAWVGQWSDEWDDGLDDAPAPAVGASSETPVLTVLDRLAERDERIAAVRDALFDGRSQHQRRDAIVFLEHAMQEALGDPSPALTVAAAYGITPDNVRQIVVRSRRRIITAYPRLAGLALVAA